MLFSCDFLKEYTTKYGIYIEEAEQIECYKDALTKGVGCLQLERLEIRTVLR